jgi:hypothetical protein
MVCGITRSNFRIQKAGLLIDEVKIDHIPLESRTNEEGESAESCREFLPCQISFDHLKINSNLMRPSVFRSVLMNRRAWMFTMLHFLLSLACMWRYCVGPSCIDAHFPIRDAFQNFVLGFWELGPIISLCLFILTFYSNGCINIHREISGIIFSTCTSLKSLAIFVNVHHACENTRWDIIRYISQELWPIHGLFSIPNISISISVPDSCLRVSGFFSGR